MQPNLGSRTAVIPKDSNFDAEDNHDDDSKILHSNDDDEELSFPTSVQSPAHNLKVYQGTSITPTTDSSY
jgi:hypothetical protein